MSEVRKVTLLLSQLKDTDPGARSSAAEGLRRLIEYDSEIFIDSDISQRLLDVLMNDKDPEVKIAVSFAIAQLARYGAKQFIKIPNIIERLVQFVLEEFGHMVRKNLFESLSNFAETAPNLFEENDVIDKILILKEKGEAIKDRFEASRILRYLYESDLGRKLIKNSLEKRMATDFEGVKKLCEKAKWTEIWNELTQSLTL
ncbi:MAG: hypothetical protein ACTSUV_06960 [Candidatus Ranarchaeia archaeon]